MKRLGRSRCVRYHDIGQEMCTDYSTSSQVTTISETIRIRVRSLVFSLNQDASSKSMLKSSGKGNGGGVNPGISVTAFRETRSRPKNAKSSEVSLRWSYVAFVVKSVFFRKSSVTLSFLQFDKLINPFNNGQITKFDNQSDLNSCHFSSTDCTASNTIASRLFSDVINHCSCESG